MFLHEINTWIIDSLNFYSLNYIISFIFIFFFMIVAYKMVLKTLKRMIKHDKIYLRILLVMLTIDALVTTWLFFYEVFINRSILSGFLVLLVSIVVLVNSTGWLCIAYNMVHGARKNPFLGMKSYLPMLVLLTIVYLSHIHFYHSVASLISIYVLLFWELRAIITVSLSFLRTVIIFISSIFSSMDLLHKKADDIEKDLKSVFFK